MPETNSCADVSVAIVLVNWCGWRECIECIASLFAQRHNNFNVFIVDNHSHDESVERIADWCAHPRSDPAWRALPGVRRITDGGAPPLDLTVIASETDEARTNPFKSRRRSLTLVRRRQNSGFAGGCNTGVLAAGLMNFDYFWFLNPDTVVAADALTELLQRARSSPRIGIVGSTVRYYYDADVIEAMGGAKLDRSNGTSRHIGQGAPITTLPKDARGVEADLSYVMGASMLVSAEFIAAVGPMEEDYFLYYEEADWALRGMPRFALGFAPRSHVFHKSGANSSKVMPLFTAGYYYRNRLRFVARFLPDRLSAAKRSLVEQMLRHLVRRRWSHARVVLQTLLRARRIIAGVTRKP